MREHSSRDLEALDTRSLVADHASWKARFPSHQPRSVDESDALAKCPLRSTYASGLTAIRSHIEAGTDLTRYLSSQVRFAHGRDLLLAHTVRIGPNGRSSRPSSATGLTPGFWSAPASPPG